MMVRGLKILVELFAYLYCIAELFGRKLKIGIHVVVLVILDLFLVIGIDDYEFPEYLSSLIYIGIFVYGLLYYGESIKHTLVNCVLAAIAVTVFQLVMWMPLYFLFFIKYGQNKMNELLINIGCFLLIMLCSNIIEWKRISDFVIRRNKMIVGISAFVLCGLAVSFYHMKGEGMLRGDAYLQMMYFFFIFLFTIYEWQKSKADAEKKKAQLEMNGLYYDAYDQLLMLIRERQHDMKSHINAILGMIYTTDNYEELIAKQKEYCDYVIGQNEKTRLVLSTGNPLIVGFLYSKIQEAEHKGIATDYKIEMQKAALAVPEYELVEMAGILIDNAIEALSNTNEVVDKYNQLKKIYISMKETKNHIELAVANTSSHYEEDMTEKFFEVGYSSKGKERGIGLPKLKRMVRDKKGDIIVSNETYNGVNYLQFSIIMPLKETRQKL